LSTYFAAEVLHRVQGTQGKVVWGLIDGNLPTHGAQPAETEVVAGLGREGEEESSE
jgi:hypothetical protein